MKGFDNSRVRRQDRLLGEDRAEEILMRSEYGFLALGGNGGYGIPVSYAYKADDTIYIHCAPEGEKLRRIAADNRATLCAVGHTRVIPEKFTTEYESVMVRGTVSVVSDDNERMDALKRIVAKYSPGHTETGARYAEKSFARTTVLRFAIESATGKTKIVG